jgi:hypothetical protein
MRKNSNKVVKVEIFLNPVILYFASAITIVIALYADFNNS